MRRLITAIMTAGAVFSSAGLARASVVHVPDDAASIQEGLDQAASGDTVEVACGTYYEHNIRMKSGVVLRSATGLPDCVTIDGQQMDRVIYCLYISPATRIEGFTITGGHTELTFEDEGNGGGILCQDNSSPSIVHCNLVGNYSGYDGGGLACESTSSPTVVECNITMNEANNGGSGVRCELNSNPTFSGCDISDNVGTGLWASNSSSPVLTGCHLSGNSATALRIQTKGDVSLVDCVLEGNDGYEGAAVFNWAGNVTLTRCTLASNSASASGGGLYLLDGTASLQDCALTSNHAHAGAGIYLDGTSNATITNSTFQGNKSGPSKNGFVAVDSELDLVCSASDLTGFSGTGTIVLDNSGCVTEVESTTWGALKHRYH